MKTRTWPILALVLAVLWVFVRGPDPTIDAVVGAFFFGVVVGVPIAFLFRKFYSPTIDPVRVVRVVPYAVLYVLVFLQEVIVANVDVAYRSLAPGPPLEPEVIYLPLRVQTDFAITTIANSVTITPGTLALDHDHDRNALYIHVINGRDIESIVEPIRTWEEYALVIFDEELDRTATPDDVIVTSGDGDGD